MPEYPRIPLGDIAPKADSPMPASDTHVWNLSLEDIEAGSGAILKRKLCPVSELGSTKCSFDSRHVLYSKLRPYLNKVVVPDQSGVGTSELIPLLPDPERLHRDFLAYYLRSPEFVDFAVAHSRGANLPRVAMRALWAHRVPAPPIEEQERVVGQIQEAFERVREIQMLRRESLAESAALESAVFSDFIMELTRDANVSVVPIGDIAQVNPRRDSRLRSLDEDLEVTFVPMAAVDEETGTIASPEVKPLGDVRKGFTPFLQGDVIFAKITPCMQNGKSAIAQSLVNGFGFGSTEFHVLRPGPAVLPQWLWYFVRQRSFREEARRHFRGSAGQQRVPATFVEQHKIPLPPLEQQRRIVSRIQERLKRVNELCRLLRFTPTRKVRNQIDANTSAADPNALMQAVLRKAFTGEL